MDDFEWPADLAPFAQSFYLQPHTGRSESPFTRQQKIYSLTAPRWVCRMSFRGGYDGSTGAEAYGARLDALIAKMEGGANRAEIYDFRRGTGGVSITNSAVLAGDTQATVTGDVPRVGDYTGGDGRPHLITDVEASGTDYIITVKPPFSSDIAMGGMTFDRVPGYFRLTSDDAGSNLAEVGQAVGYDLEFIEDLNPIPAEILMAPANYDFAEGAYRTAGARVTAANAISSNRTVAAYWPIGALPVTSVAAGVARIHDGALIMERASTNLLPDPSLTGAAVGVLGAGGALPTDAAMNLPGFTTEVLSVAQADGAIRMRVKVARSGGSPSTATPTLRLDTLPGVVSASGGVHTFSGAVGIVSKTGVTSVSALVLEYTSPGAAFVSANSEVLADTAVVTPFDVARTITAGNAALAAISWATTTATSDFEIVLDLTLLQLETGTQTSWIPSGTREDETITLDCAAGTYDVMQSATGGGSWTDDQVVSTGLTITRPSAITPYYVGRVLGFDAGLTAQEKNALVEAITVPEYQQKIFRFTNDFGTWQRHTKETPDFPEHSLQEEVGRANVYRFEARIGEHPDFDDPRDGTANANERAEIYRHDGVSDVYAFPFNTDVWISGSLFIETTAVIDTRYCIILQASGQPDVGEVDRSPALCLQFSDGLFNIETRTSPLASDALNPVPLRHYEDASFPTRQWVDLLIKVNFDWNNPGTGVLQVWRDGTQIVDYAGPVGFNDVDGPYVKCGIYRESTSQITALRWANFQATTDDLSALAAAPLPVI